VVEEALKLSPLAKVIWMQLGARDDAAAEKAEAAGLKVVMKPLPENRIWPAVVGDFVDGRQFPHAEFKRAPVRRRACGCRSIAQCRRWPDRRIRPRRERQERAFMTQLRNDYFRKRGLTKH